MFVSFQGWEVLYVYWWGQFYPMLLIIELVESYREFVSGIYIWELKFNSI